ncbi:related to ser/thr protein kinases [Melanopsichium pennsylvanicum]|uniref:non-specific serine/threonine protein kinase n=2 Tax=Melanopsichium pennsylvanicum TaxID=63383 RepID=A0AAJ4XPJ3_9BASI|nr:related to ser/thr protein kinases [Melanopsichium pennsylvanicum 4]SNX86769.1 related to ser/thr protein kinases [Melanopsichium pennsylvanicum]
MSHPGDRRAYRVGGQGIGGSTINQKAALASAYQELGKELASSKLKIVGNYTLQRPIGEGTFGKVRLGLHRLTNTRVAIKQIPKAHSASLTREIHHHRRLHHPNVMQLYEVIATEQYIWMVSELCAGGELYDYLVENEVLAEPEARRIFGQLCLAVAYVHSKGIVHRDLKLENILLDERCNVKLGDFGFTREFEHKRLMDTFCGTTGYASPEMLAGKKYTGQEVDIWSLGVILYALLCGALPFDDDDESVMKDKILRGDFEIPDCLSEDAQSLIASILQHDPNKRPKIQAILAHPWFAKMMVHTPMSTVEEHDNATDYFDSRPPAEPTQANQTASHQSAAIQTHAISDTSEETDTLLAAPPATAAPFSSYDLSRLHQHQASASSITEGSYHSARSDSESSGRRSSNTDLTDPTTADSLSRTDEMAEFNDIATSTADTNISPSLASSPTPAAGSSHSGKNNIGLHRNESQTTIRRLGSNGSDASLGPVSRAPMKPTSTSLPTHHELPAGSFRADDIPLPMYQSAPLVKRGSQSSSRGHHRTPSRTKRRSLSSGGLSDHRPPMLGRKPVDYVSQLADLQPATFSTTVEQNLLHQLSSLGMDVGQMVHSVVTDACDASGATWWMLLRKAKDRQAEQPMVTSPAAESVHMTIDERPLTVAATPTKPSRAIEPMQVEISPPPVPVKDPARRSEDRSRSKERPRSSLTASRSESSGLADGSYRRLQTVVSHEELDVSAVPTLHATTSEALIGTSRSASIPPSNPTPAAAALAFSTSPLVNDRSLTSTPESNGSPRPRSQYLDTTTTAASPSKLHQVATSLVGSSTTLESPKTRRGSQVDRPRSNSLSVKQFAQTVLGTKDKASGTPPPIPQPEQVIVAGEAFPLERAKSPTLFGRRNTVSNVKDSMVGRLSSPSTPKKSTVEVLDKSRMSTGKRSIEADFGRVKALDHSAHPSSSSASTFGLVCNSTLASASTVAAAAGDRKDGAVPSASQDSFSTMSLTPHGSEKSGARGKAGSSFMATVRTWLGGTNEKPTRKFKTRKKGAAYHSLGIDDGMNARPPTSTLGTSRQGRPSSSHSLAHTGAAPRSGLQGKAGSTGSTSSVYRSGQASSAYSTGSARRHPRPSHDAGTTVRRHRAYASSSGSPSRRSSWRNDSRPSSIKSRASSPGRAMSGLSEFGVDAETDADAGGTGARRSTRSTPRHSLELRGISDSRKASKTFEPIHPGHQQMVAQSIFVAHKSRSPYRPPSANLNLHGGLTRGFNHPPHRSAGDASDVSASAAPITTASLPATRTGTWRHSWGRPPPCWAGPVDPPPVVDTTGTSADDASDKPKLRDVFANREDDDWTDEDEEPSYSGGLGQMGSISSQSTSTGHGAGGSSSSPYATRNFATLGSVSSASSGFQYFNSDSGTSADAFRGAVAFSSRYAGVRNIFPNQPSGSGIRTQGVSLSLGNEFAPKVLSATLDSETKSSGGGLPSLGEADGSTSASNVGATAPKTETTSQAQQPIQHGTGIGGGGSRITASFHKPTQIIEEEEEDE